MMIYTFLYFQKVASLLPYDACMCFWYLGIVARGWNSISCRDCIGIMGLMVPIKSITLVNKLIFSKNEN